MGYGDGGRVELPGAAGAKEAEERHEEHDGAHGDDERECVRDVADRLLPSHFDIAWRRHRA